MKNDPLAHLANHPSDAAALPEHRIEEALTINFIHEGLRGSQSLDSLLKSVVAMLLSRSALGFSRALIFRWDETTRDFGGYGVFGAEDSESHEAVQAEIVSEQRYLDRKARDHGPLAENLPSEESIFSHDPEDDRRSVFWNFAFTKIAQRSEPVSGFEDCRLPWTGGTVNFFLHETDSNARLFRRNSSLLLDKQRIAQSTLPEEVKKMLPGQSLWAGIRTKRGPRLVLAVDNRYTPRSINTIDCLHMNWFCGQVALAMENVELISDLKASNETLREVDTLKSNFLSTISHELRTPLTMITGFTRLVIDSKSETLSEGQREILEKVMGHAGRLADVVNDLIEIVEIDAGTALNMNIRAVDPLESLVEILPKLEPRRARKCATIRPETEGEIPKILADPRGLSRVFYHLIDNAIKFSQTNGLVTIRFEPRELDLAIEIEDRGIGIAPYKLQAIFDAFYQVDGDLSREYEGMGVGLTLTKKLIQGTGGRLEVDSELEKGSVFRIIFPKA